MGAETTDPEPQDCVCGHADWLHTAYLADPPDDTLKGCDVATCDCPKFEAKKEPDGR